MQHKLQKIVIFIGLYSTTILRDKTMGINLLLRLSFDYRIFCKVHLTVVWAF